MGSYEDGCTCGYGGGLRCLRVEECGRGPDELGVGAACEACDDWWWFAVGAGCGDTWRWPEGLQWVVDVAGLAVDCGWWYDYCGGVDS